VVDDRLDRLTDRRIRVALLQSVPRDVLLDHALAERRRIVHVADAEKAGARIRLSRRVSCRELDERVVHAHRERVRRRRDGAHQPARVLAGERDRRLDLGVLREVLRAREVERGARRLHAIAPLVHAAERAATPCASRRKKSVASTSTLLPERAAAVHPHSVEVAKASSTARRSIGLSVDARKFRFGWTIRTFGPTRWKRTTCVLPRSPRFSPMSLCPTPAGSDV